MARIYEQALEELTDTKEELKAVEAMSETEACNLYNVDSKTERKNMPKSNSHLLLRFSIVRCWLSMIERRRSLVIDSG